jgi:hypothetical protein
VLAQLDKAQEQEIRNEGEDAKSTTHAGRGDDHDSDKEEQRQLDRQVTLNVGGRTFKTFQLHLPAACFSMLHCIGGNPDVFPSPPPRSTLQQYPDTLLGAMFSERNQALVRHSTEYFFDRNGDLFASILDFYRHGYAPASSILAGVLVTPTILHHQSAGGSADNRQGPMAKGVGLLAFTPCGRGAPESAGDAPQGCQRS